MIAVLLSFGALDLLSEDINELDKQAELYYKNKQIDRAIAIWIKILEIDPENERIQRKIEFVYEEKHRKDLSLQRAKKHYRLAKKIISENLKVGKSNADVAIKNFVIAYRIDPQDPELQSLKEDMRKLQEEVKIEEAKKRLSEEMKKKYLELLQQANQMMDQEQYETALKLWKEILGFMPMDKIAKEGRRKAKLAISNRLKYERIKRLLSSGIVFFKDKKYKRSRLDFEEILRIDPENSEAEDYIEDIDDLLEDQRDYAFKRVQAEKFYVSGIRNIQNKNFDQAEEDLENTLALIDNYKDARSWLRNLSKLKKDYKKQKERMRVKKIDEKFQAGITALTAGKYEDAIAEFVTILKMDSRNKLAKEYMKSAKDALKQKQEEIVDENSSYFHLVNSLITSGKMLYGKGKYAESKKRWESILNLFPQNRIAMEYRLKCDLHLNPRAYQEFLRKTVEEGKYFLKKKKFKQALKKFEFVKSIAPGYAGLSGFITSSKVGQKADDTKKFNPVEVEKRYQLGMAYYRRGGADNIRRALGHFQWIVARNPQHVKAAINANRIASQLRVGTGAAIKRGRNLSAKQKTLVRRYYFRGINYYSKNKFGKAIYEWRRVLAIDPGHVKARNNIRKCLVLLRR